MSENLEKISKKSRKNAHKLEKLEELEELEDYSPQHPLLAYEPKMNLVRAPDHLQQYVEVNPFEHQFQPAEVIYGSWFKKTPPKGKEHEYVTCEVSASLSWRNNINYARSKSKNISAPDIVEVNNLKVYLKPPPTTIVYVKKCSDIPEDFNPTKEQKVAIDKYKKDLLNAVIGKRSAFLSSWKYNDGQKDQKLSDLFELGTSMSNETAAWPAGAQASAPQIHIYLRCKSSKITGWMFEFWKRQDEKFKRDHHKSYKAWKKNGYDY